LSRTQKELIPQRHNPWCSAFTVAPTKRWNNTDVSFVGPATESLSQIRGQRRRRQAIIQKIEPKLFNPERFEIMKILYDLREVEFKDLQNDLGLTAGNLASHFRVLEGLGYVTYAKDFAGRRQRTVYTLTPEGIRAFREFVRVLRDSLPELGDSGA